MPAFLHSYYPLGVNIPEYLPNESSVFSLIGQFALLWAAIVGIAWLIISRSRPGASSADHLAFVWFCLSMFVLTIENRSLFDIQFSCVDPPFFRRLFRGESYDDWGQKSLVCRTVEGIFVIRFAVPSI